MKIAFEQRFLRDLKKIDDQDVLGRVEKAIAEIKTAKTLSQLQHIRKMRTHENYYRLRLGDYRIGLEVLNDTVFFVRVLNRKDIYRYFP